MSRLLKLALIQQQATRKKQNNIKRAVSSFEKAAKQGAQLIVFAELAFTYFYPQKPSVGNNEDLAEPIPGPTTEIFSKLARKWHTVVILNLFEKLGNQTFDSSPVIDANGKILGITRMVHIMEGPCFHEQGYYFPGDGQQLVFDTAVGKIGVAICYDRHYPEYMRALALQGAELAVVPQAGAVGEWPSGLFEAEMQVAGFQNGYFTALCNRVGKEDCIEFEGKSFITAPDGQILAQAPAGEDAILIHEIDLDEVKNSHAQKHFLKDRRQEVYPKWFGF
ncbi:carbon-nitrogen hydrolase family protein [candidate division KSB1 bacterium]|nr:carbon-nitrogen hydrolase family protein [candidate division KSB1 bacterium]MBL7094810.1 carbon-nitrogen hydrolase family protein [candidate division KSB1 bacterium]